MPAIALFGVIKPKFHGSSFLVASSSDTTDTPDFLVTCYRHRRDICHEDGTKKLLPCDSTQLVVVVVVVAADVHEFCEGETFSARCRSHDEVVLMTSAHYGRMRLGRCLAVNYGNLGCQLDVRTQFDAWCSGRRTCDVRVSSIIDSLPDEEFPCTRDFRGYLEASYVCVKGLLRQHRQIFFSSYYLITNKLQKCH